MKDVETWPGVRRYWLSPGPVLEALRAGMTHHVKVTYGVPDDGRLVAIGFDKYSGRVYFDIRSGSFKGIDLEMEHAIILEPVRDEHPVGAEARRPDSTA